MKKFPTILHYVVWRGLVQLGLNSVDVYRSLFEKDGKESSLFQLKAFQAELDKAKLKYQYEKERHERVHPLTLTGAVSWVFDHELELEVEKSRQAVDGWARKCKEQEKQYLNRR